MRGDVVTRRLAVTVALVLAVIGGTLALARGYFDRAEPSQPARVARTKPAPRPKPLVPLIAATASNDPEPSGEPPNPLPLVDFGKAEDAVPIHVAPSLEAAAERDATLAALRATGPDGGRFREHFDDVSGEWQGILAREHIATNIGAWECFAGGCAITLEFEVQEDLETFSHVAMAGISTKRWKGGGFRSGPIEVASGKIAATWIFSAPPKTSARVD